MRKSKTLIAGKWKKLLTEISLRGRECYFLKPFDYLENAKFGSFRIGNGRSIVHAAIDLIEMKTKSSNLMLNTLSLRNDRNSMTITMILIADD